MTLVRRRSPGVRGAGRLALLGAAGLLVVLAASCGGGAKTAAPAQGDRANGSAAGGEVSATVYASPT